jgi:hypothetical protein
MAFGVAMLLAVPARAQTPDLARADALFKEGRALMDRGELDLACPKLEESFRIAPRLGTMINLGGCFERRGQLSRALAMYERAATMARDAGRADREKAARELAARVERRVAKLIVELPTPSVEGLVVEVDAEAISLRAGLLPIDPGKRVVRARAPGKQTWSTEVTASPGATVRVTIPTLESETTAEKPTKSAVEPAPARLVEPTAPWRTPAVITAAAIGVGGVALGTVFGLKAKSKNDDAQPHCNAVGCDSNGVALIDQARSAGNISTVSFIVGGAALATAVVLYLVVPAGSHVVAPTAEGVRVAF